MDDQIHLDEDLERFRATSRNFAMEILRAYKIRYPDPDEYEMNVIINSMSLALLTYLEMLDKNNRNKFILNLIDMLLEARKYE